MSRQFAVLLVVIAMPSTAPAQTLAGGIPAPSRSATFGAKSNGPLEMAASWGPEDTLRRRIRPTHWKKGAVIGGISGGAFFGVLGIGFCGNSDAYDKSCIGPVLGATAAGALMGATLGSLIGGQFPRTEPARTGGGAVAPLAATIRAGIAGYSEGTPQAQSGPTVLPGPSPNRILELAPRGPLRQSFNHDSVRRDIRPTHWKTGALIGGVAAGLGFALVADGFCRSSDSSGDCGSALTRGFLGGGVLGGLVGALVGGQFPKEDDL